MIGFFYFPVSSVVTFRLSIYSAFKNLVGFYHIHLFLKLLGNAPLSRLKSSIKKNFH